MNNRNTLCQPNLDNLNYVLIEQKGDENFYKLSAREIKDGTQGSLICILGTAQDINNYCGLEIIHLTEDQKIDIKVQNCAKQLNKVFGRLKIQNLGNQEINIYSDDEGKQAIKHLIHGISEDNVQKLFDDKLRKELTKYGLKFFRPDIVYFTDQKSESAAWFNILTINKQDTETTVIHNELDIVHLKHKKKYKPKEAANGASIKAHKNGLNTYVIDGGKESKRILLTYNNLP